MWNNVGYCFNIVVNFIFYIIRYKTMYNFGQVE